MRSTNIRTVANVVSVSDKSKSLKLKSIRRNDWADGIVATFRHTQKHTETNIRNCREADLVTYMNIKVCCLHYFVGLMMVISFLI